MDMKQFSERGNAQVRERSESEYGSDQKRDMKTVSGQCLVKRFSVEATSGILRIVLLA